MLLSNWLGVISENTVPANQGALILGVGIKRASGSADGQIECENSQCTLLVCVCVCVFKFSCVS